MYDVIIIGGGICGCSLLYMLCRYNIRVALFEKENDIGVGSTKANSGIIHAGYDPVPGTLMAKYNVTGNELIRQLCSELDIHFKETGSLVVALNPEERSILERLNARGQANGVPGLRLLERDELLALEPNVNPDALCALHAPTAGVVSSWELASAQAEVAVSNGAALFRSSEVSNIERKKNYFILTTEHGTVKARFVVNAGGLQCENITKMLENPVYSLHPSRGQYYLLDKNQGELVRHVIFQCPTNRGKGVLVAPTTNGTLLVGPDSNPADLHDLSTTAAGLEYVRQTALRSVPSLRFDQTIRNFAGLRARADTHDFIVGESQQTPGFFEISGIRSPGLTAAPAIARDVLEMLANAGLALTKKQRFVIRRHVLRFRHLSEAEKAMAIRDNPLYGKIVCRCETITEGEIVDALHRPVPPLSLDGIKRRCLPGMGRCQGGFCGPRVQEIIARELGVPIENVPQDRTGMNIILGKTKDPLFKYP